MSENQTQGSSKQSISLCEVDKIRVNTDRFLVPQRQSVGEGRLQNHKSLKNCQRLLSGVLLAEVIGVEAEEKYPLPYPWLI